MMTVTREPYRDWPTAYRCTIGNFEIIVVTTIGPRIMSFRTVDGENVLYEDHTDFSVGTWKLYGGHRFATAPEGSASYLPDKDSCDSTFENGELIIRQRPNSIDLQKTMRIRGLTHGDGFEILHEIQNLSKTPWSGSPWAITCIKTQGRILLPWGSLPNTCNAGVVHYWRGIDGNYLDHTSSQWQPADSHYVIEPIGQRGKVSMFNERAWMALLRDEVAFIKSCEGVRLADTYPHGGCNLEVFTCPDYIELETLGPQVTLAQGESQSHAEYWRLLKGSFLPRHWQFIEQMATRENMACSGA